MDRKKQAGFALATMGMWILALGALAALAVDVSRLALTATEVQAVADAAATAGAKALSTGDDHVVAAKFAAAQNKADRTLFDVTTYPDWYALDPIQMGKYDRTTPPGTDPFTPDLTPANAVRVTATAKDVNFIFGGFFSTLMNLVNGGNDPIGTSTPITKMATAVCAPPGGLPPDLPITVCDTGNIDLHVFQPGEACDPDQLGTISRMNPLPEGSQDSCWTDLGTGDSNPSNNAVKALLPPDCGGSEDPADHVSVTDNDTMNVNNGTFNNLFNDLVACINAPPYNGTRRFTIPVMDCGPCNAQDVPVKGFVTLEIKADDIKTNASIASTFGSCATPCPDTGCKQGIYCAKQVCNSSSGGIGIGEENFGSCIVRLFQ